MQTKLEQYLDTLSALQGGKARKILEKRFNYAIGGAMSRAENIERRVLHEKGYILRSTEWYKTTVPAPIYGTSREYRKRPTLSLEYIHPGDDEEYSCPITETERAYALWLGAEDKTDYESYQRALDEIAEQKRRDNL